MNKVRCVEAPRHYLLIYRPLQGDQVTRELDVPKDSVGMIIGRKGMILKQLKARHKCNIHVAADPLDENPTVKRITITGATSSIPNCIKV